MALTLHKVVEQIYLDARVNEFLKKLRPEHLQEDLKSHCITEIYRVSEKYPGKIEWLAERDQLFAWFVGMAKMQLFSTRSTFYRKHRRCFADDTWIDIETPEAPQEFEFKEHDPEKERMIEWAYSQIERPDRKKRQWLRSTLIEADPLW